MGSGLLAVLMDCLEHILWQHMPEVIVFFVCGVPFFQTTIHCIYASNYLGHQRGEGKAPSLCLHVLRTFRRWQIFSAVGQIHN